MILPDVQSNLQDVCSRAKLKTACTTLKPLNPEITQPENLGPQTLNPNFWSPVLLHESYHAKSLPKTTVERGEDGTVTAQPKSKRRLRFERFRALGTCPIRF